MPRFAQLHIHGNNVIDNVSKLALEEAVRGREGFQFFWKAYNELMIEQQCRESAARAKAAWDAKRALDAARREAARREAEERPTEQREERTAAAEESEPLQLDTSGQER